MQRVATQISRRVFAAASGASMLFLHARDAFPAGNAAGLPLEELCRKAEQTGFGGCVYVARDGRAVLDGAYGWTAPGSRHRVDRTTLFNIASVTKTLTATAVFRLIEQKRLALDTKLVDIYRATPSDKREITVDMLLTHTSGLPHSYAANGCRTREDALQAIFALKLESPPGRDFRYTDDGYALLAAVMESRSGRTYNECMRGTVLVPAGMQRTRFWEEIDDRSDENVGRIIPVPIEDRYRGVNWGYRGSGGLWSTAEDLARYFFALRAGSLVDLATANLMMSPRRSVSVGAVGYEWFIGKSTLGTPLIFSRGNEDWGHSALIFWYPDRGLVQTIVTNSGFQNDIPRSRILAGQLERVLLV